MPNEILVKERATQLSFADHATDFSPAAGSSLEQGTPTDVQISMASVADAAARQSAKFDFGATRAGSYNIVGSIEFAASVVAGNSVDLYLAESPDATAANGNPGGASGSDAAYTGTTGSTVAESVLQMTRIGKFTTSDDATTTVQTSKCGGFSPKERYGSLVVVNNAGVALHSDDVESHIVFDPIVVEVQ